MRTKAGKPLQILLVDDHCVVRSALRMLIESHPGLLVIAEAACPQEAREKVRQIHPDLVLLDLDLEGTIHFDLIQELQSIDPRVKILVLTGLRDPTVHSRVRSLGVCGVVLKEQAANALLDAIVASDFQPKAHDEMGTASAMRSEPEPPLHPSALTSREWEIVHLVGAGLRNQEIADRLLISEGTVRNHLTVIYEKLNLTGRYQLMAYLHQPQDGAI